MSQDLPATAFYGVDSYYHAHRTRQQFEQWPKLAYHDSKMNHPSGAIAQWPLGFDFMNATWMRVIGRFAGSWPQIDHLLAFANIGLGWIAVLAFVGVLRRYLSWFHSISGGLLLSLNLGFVSVSAAGNYDHHCVEALGVIVLFLVAQARTHLRSRPKAVALGLALTLVIWSSTLMAYLAILASFIGLVITVYENHRGERSRGASGFVWLLSTVSVTLLAVCLVEGAARGRFVAAETLGLAHWGALTSILWAQHLLAHRLHWKWFALAVVVGIAAVALAVPNAIAWVATYAVGAGSMISNVNESLPIFMARSGPTFKFISTYFGWVYLAFPLVIILLRRRWARGDHAALLIWFGLALFMLSLSQRRFVHLFSPGFIAVTWIWACRLFEKGYKKHVTCFLAAGLLLLPVIQLGPGSVSIQPPSTKQALDVAYALKELPSSPGGGVSAPPNWGSPITYVTGRPTTSNAFYYPEYLELDHQLRNIESDQTFIDTLHRNRIDYLVAADDVRYRTMLLEQRGEHEEALLSERQDSQPCAAYHLKFAYYRLSCRPASIPGLVLVSARQYTRDGRKLYRKVSLYRVGQAP